MTHVIVVLGFGLAYVGSLLLLAYMLSVGRNRWARFRKRQRLAAQAQSFLADHPQRTRL